MSLESGPASTPPPREKSPPLERSAWTLRNMLPDVPAFTTFHPREMLQFAGVAALVAVTPAKAEEVAERTVNPEHQRIAESVLGAEVVDALRTRGFEITVPLEADENGSYVIHMGQTHTSPDAGFGRLVTKDQVGAFQATLYEVLPSVLEASQTAVVFGEGYASNPDDQRDIILRIKNYFDSSDTVRISSLAEAQDVASYIEWFHSYGKHRLVRNSIPASLVAPLEQKLTVFIDNFVPANDFEREEIDLLKVQTSIGAYGGIIDIARGDSEFDSALARLYMEERLQIAPAETVEANQAAMEMVDRGRELKSEYRSARHDATYRHADVKPYMDELRSLAEARTNGMLPDGGEERTELVKALARAEIAEKTIEFEASATAIEYQRAEAEVDYKIKTIREKVALSRIQEFEAANGVLAHPVVVYGRAHEFGPELEAFNAANPADAPDRGLIEIKIPKGGGAIEQSEELAGSISS